MSTEVFAAMIGGFLILCIAQEIHDSLRQVTDMGGGSRGIFS